MFENRVLRRIFGPKRDEVTGEWKRLHNKELYALYSSPNIIQVVKSKIIRWAGHVARMGERRGWQDPMETDHLIGLGVDGKMILPWMCDLRLPLGLK